MSLWLSAKAKRFVEKFIAAVHYRQTSINFAASPYWLTAQTHACYYTFTKSLQSTMKTLQLEIDESIYTQVLEFLRLLPEKQCHIIEAPQNMAKQQHELDITASFGLIKTPITASLADIEAGIVAGAVRDSD